MGLFGGSKVSSATSTAASGLGAFNPKNNISLGKPLVDITKPSQVLGLIFVVSVGFLAWKKIKWRGG